MGGGGRARHFRFAIFDLKGRGIRGGETWTANPFDSPGVPGSLRACGNGFEARSPFGGAQGKRSIPARRDSG